MIELMLGKLYAKWGISDRTDFSKLTPADYPILSDLYELIETEYKAFDAQKYQLYTAELLQEILLGLHSMLCSCAAELAKGYKIKPEHLRWYAAFHDKSHHPHIHMLWMLEQYTQLGEIVLCLDNDDAGVKASERLTGFLAEHGYGNIRVDHSEEKDWNDELVRACEAEEKMTMEME